MTARSSAVRSTLMRAGSAGAGTAMAGQVDGDHAEGTGEGGRVRAPGRAAAGEPVQEEQGRTRPAGADLPAEAIDQHRAHGTSPASAVGDDRGHLAVQRHVARSIRPELEDADAGPADGVRNRRAEVRGSDEPVLPAQRGHDRPDVDAVRRPEQLLVVLREAGAGSRGRGLGLGQEREDPAAVVVDQDDRGGERVEPRRDQGVEVVEERDIADDEGDRPVRDRRGPEGRGDDAVDAVGAAVRADGDGAVRGREPAVHVAHRHRACRPTGRRRRGARRPGRGTGRLRTARPRAASHASIASPAARSASSQSAVQAWFAGAAQQAGEAPRPVVGRVGMDEGRRDERRLAPAGVAVQDQQLRARAAEQLHDRLGGRHGAGPDDEVGCVGVDPRARGGPAGRRGR